MNNKQPGTNIGDGPLKNVKQALPPRDNQHTLRERIIGALISDFNSLYSPLFTTDYQVQRSMRALEVKVMSLDALEQLVRDEVKAALEQESKARQALNKEPQDG